MPTYLHFGQHQVLEGRKVENIFEGVNDLHIICRICFILGILEKMRDFTAGKFLICIGVVRLLIYIDFSQLISIYQNALELTSVIKSSFSREKADADVTPSHQSLMALVWISYTSRAFKSLLGRELPSVLQFFSPHVFVLVLSPAGKACCQTVQKQGRLLYCSCLDAVLTTQVCKNGASLQ